MIDALIDGRGLVFEAGGRRIIDGVDLVVARRQIVTLIGPNGSGKTTLVRLLLGLQTPTAGKVRRAPGVRIGYVPQFVAVDRTFPLTARRFVTLSPGAVAPGTDGVLARLGISHLADRQFSDLSGGERQKVLLARALLRDPDLLVLDEPTQGVDVTGQDEIHGLIRRVRDETGAGVLVVSHDLHLVMAATDDVVCLNGHICCSGAPSAIRADPAFQALFGPNAVYVHRHDHDHNHGDNHDHEQRSGDVAAPEAGRHQETRHAE